MDRTGLSRCFLTTGATTRVLEEALVRPSKTLGWTLIDFGRGGAVAPLKPVLSIFNLKTILEITRAQAQTPTGPIIYIWKQNICRAHPHLNNIVMFV